MNIEMQNLSQDDREDREHDFQGLINILIGRTQLKRVEPAMVERLNRLEAYFDLLPFSIHGFRLINRASLFEGNFTQKYILKQIRDLNLELSEQQQEHYFVKAAISIADGVATWSFFVSLFILTAYLLQVSLDGMLYNLLVLSKPTIDSCLSSTTCSLSTTNTDIQQTHNLSEEQVAIWFLFILLPLRLSVWTINLIVRFIGLRYFRKNYTTLTMFLDFLLAVFTIIIVGFCTRLDITLAYATAQTQTELVLSYTNKIVRNMIIFILFLIGMVQSKKAMDSVKRLCLLFGQKEVSCCNFISF